MAPKASKASASSQDIAPQLNVRERLLLAQVTYELGCKDWARIATLLSKHPLIDRPTGFYTPASCHSAYVTLMKEMDVDLEDGVPPELENPKASQNLTLAQKWYKERMTELKQVIIQNEEKFNTLLQEIQAIKTGEWDERIAEEEPAIEPVVEEKRKKGKSAPSGNTRRSTRSGARVSEPPQTPTEPSAKSRHSKTPSMHSLISKPSENVVNPRTTDNDDTTIESTEGGNDEPAVPEKPVSKTELATELAPSVEPETRAESGPPAVVDGLLLAKESSDQMEVDVPPSAGPATPAAAEVAPNETTSSVAQAAAGDDSDEAPAGTKTVSRRSTRRQTITRSNAKAKAEPTPSVASSRDRKRGREISEATNDDDAASGSAPKRPRVRGVVPRTPAVPTTPVAAKKFQNVITLLHTSISAHRNASTFQQPIKESEVIGYHEIVKRPIDLKTIKTKIKDGSIKDSLEFQRDTYLMYANAIMYNRPGTLYFEQAKQMYLETEHFITAHRQTEGFHPE